MSARTGQFPAMSEPVRHHCAGSETAPERVSVSGVLGFLWGRRSLNASGQTAILQAVTERQKSHTLSYPNDRFSAKQNRRRMA